MNKKTNQLVQEIKTSDASVERVQELIEAGADANEDYALAEAAWYGHVDIV